MNDTPLQCKKEGTQGRDAIPDPNGLRERLILVGRRVICTFLVLISVLACSFVGGVTRDGELDLQIQNKTEQTLCELYVKTANSHSQWGRNILGAEEQIAPDEIYTVNNLREGRYDLRGRECGPEAGWGVLEYDVDVPSGEPFIELR